MAKGRCGSRSWPTALPRAYREHGRAELRIPANAPLFRGNGVGVLTVDDGSRLKVTAVILGRALGKTVKVVSGLDADDRVFVNPPDSAVTGVAVRVAPAEVE